MNSKPVTPEGPLYLPGFLCRQTSMKTRLARALTACALFAFSSGAGATEPSPVKATGVVSEEFGIDHSNWDQPPNPIISFTQTEKIFPTTIIKKGKTVQPLKVSPRQLDIGEISINDPVTRGSITIEELLTRISNEGLIILRRGEVVHESYRNGLDRDTRHINMSTTKSFIGMLAGIAIAQRLIDPGAPIGKYVPEVAGLKAWDDITVQHVLDMRSGLPYNEDYDDPNSDVTRQERASGWRPLPTGDVDGALPWVTVNMTAKEHEAGSIFNYNSSLTNVLGRAIETVFGNDLATVFEEMIWQKLGTEHDAGFGQDRKGFHLAEGTLSMTLRDLARSGNLVLAKGTNSLGEQVVASAFFDDLVEPNNALKYAFEKNAASAMFPGGNYRNQFWIRSADKKQVFMLGIHGQSCYIDYENDLVIVTFGAYPLAKDLIWVESIKSMWDGIAEAINER